MIKRILVAVDGSPSATGALSIAGSLAGIIKAELVGLYVEDISRLQQIPNADHSNANNQNAETAKQTEEAIEEESVRLYQEFQNCCKKAGIEGRFLSLRGKPIEVIRERAKTVDFVVLGNSGLHLGLKNKQPGETVQSLMSTVARPVLVVPEGVAGEPKVVIAYDGSLPSDRALRAAAEFAEISEMDSLHLLTVSKTTAECQTIQAPAIDYLSAYDFHVTPVCITGAPEEAVISYANQIDASIIVVAAFGPKHLQDSIFGSTTESVLKQSDAAVLLVA